jgi:hypothetical protein
VVVVLFELVVQKLVQVQSTQSLFLLWDSTMVCSNGFR